MDNKKVKKGPNMAGMAIIGAVLASAAAGAYVFLGPKGKKNQKQVKEWTVKMKDDVVRKLKNARKVSEPVYNDIIDSVARTYEKGARENRGEVLALARDLKKHWKAISKSAVVVKGDVVKAARKIVKKARE